MLTILVLIGSVTILGLLLFVIVVIGIRQEPPTEELTEQAPSLIATFVRRFLGVYVCKPDSPSNLSQGDKVDTSLPATPASAQWTGRIPTERQMTILAARARHAIRVEGPRRGRPIGPNASKRSCRGR